MVKEKKIILGITGSIAAYKACDLIRRFSERGVKVSVVMTKSAEKFITALTLSRLSQDKVYTDMFDTGKELWDMEHISLAKVAQAVLVAPATANIIGKLASGIADDLLTCTCLSTKAPIIIAPAMNPAMFSNPVVQENCEKLKKRGVHLIGPVKGKVACGDKGLGHIAETEDIVETVLKAVK